MITGKYVVIEGGEGVGKTTQAELLIQRLAQHNVEAVYIQEPGSTAFAQALRGLIKSNTERTSKTNVLTFNAARAETMAQIEGILATGKWVISDRSYLSTIAYQGYGEGQDIEAIRAICKYAASRQPDVCVIIDADPEVSAERLEKRGEDGDYFEDMQSDFHQRVRDGYQTEAHQESYPIIDGNKSVNEVAEQIWDEIKPLLSDKNSKKKRKTNPYLKKK